MSTFVIGNKYKYSQTGINDTVNRWIKEKSILPEHESFHRKHLPTIEFTYTGFREEDNKHMFLACRNIAVLMTCSEEDSHCFEPF